MTRLWDDSFKMIELEFNSQQSIIIKLPEQGTTYISGASCSVGLFLVFLFYTWSLEFSW